MPGTVESIDTHLMRVWVRLCKAKATNKPLTEYWHMIDGLLDQRLNYTNTTR